MKINPKLRKKIKENYNIELQLYGLESQLTPLYKTLFSDPADKQIIKQNLKDKKIRNKISKLQREGY